jgi:hypothetical protein
MRSIVKGLSVFIFFICVLGFLLGLLELFAGNDSEKIQGLTVIATCCMTTMLAGSAYVLTEIADAVVSRIGDTKKQELSIPETT